MKNVFKILSRILVASAVCAALAACAQPTAFSSSSFPTYSGQTGTGGFVPPSIMDY